MKSTICTNTANEDIVLQIDENKLLCISPKNTYISPTSPPSGNNM